MSERLLILVTADIDSFDIEFQGELYNEYYHLVYDMVLYIVKDHAFAEDVIQEAFIRILRKRPGYVDVNKVNVWLKTLTRNVTLNYLRKNKKMRDELTWNSVYIDEAAADIFHEPLMVEDEVEGKMEFESMVALIQSLKTEYRQVMELKYIHELSYIEIAKSVGITEGAVRQRLARARDTIKNLIMRNEVK